MVKVGTKRRMTELENHFIDESFDVQKPQNEGVEAGHENVATSNPKRRTDTSLVSKTGWKRHVPLAEVNGSIDSNEKNEQTQAKKARKEKRPSSPGAHWNNFG